MIIMIIIIMAIIVGKVVLMLVCFSVKMSNLANFIYSFGLHV